MKEQIIEHLKKSPGYLSGEEISRSFHISRAAIWKNINELRKQGYEIVAVPHLGYRLLASPDKLLPWEIAFGLKTKVFGRPIVYHEVVRSTMDDAFRLGAQGAPEGTVVVAESQTSGRGRLGRVWSSPKGKGIYMSVILRPALSAGEVAKLTLLSAVAICEAVNKAGGVKARIKWPNDILLNRKKLAGILTELSAEVDRVKIAVVGLGININTPASQLPPQGTSLKMERGQHFSRVEILQAILQSFEDWYNLFQQKGFAPVLSRWKELSVTLGCRVRVSDPGGVIEGEAVDLDADGGLLVRWDSGVVTKRMSGDVVVLGG